MSTLALVLTLAGGLFALRLSGFSLASVTIPSRWERALGFVPIATLTALVTTSLTARSTDVPHGIVAAITAAGIAYATRRTWACIVGGMLVYWLITIVL